MIQYYIINENTGAWTLMTFPYRGRVEMLKWLYPNLLFIEEDKTLHGDKLFLDVSKYHRYLDGVRDE